MATKTAQPTHVKTDYSRWRLRDERGTQTWHYLTEEQAKEWPQSTADKYHLGLSTVRRIPLLAMPPSEGYIYEGKGREREK